MDKAKQNEASFVACCATIISSNKANGYAKAYAQAGLGLTDPEAIRVQCLYILNNIQHWRGEDSKQVREALKRIAEVK